MGFESVTLGPFELSADALRHRRFGKKSLWVMGGLSAAN